MGALLQSFFVDRIFLSILLAVVISQTSKIMVISFKHKQKFRINDLIVTGGMPSTHSSLVGSLTTIIGLTQGFSPLFFVVLAFSLIVIRDAMGVRRSVGEEGKLIEKLMKYEKIKIDKFHYSLGHTPIQVLAGLALGIASSLISHFII
jgi:uncharacterized protein